jgi:hypothetical protein
MFTRIKVPSLLFNLLDGSARCFISFAVLFRISTVEIVGGQTDGLLLHGFQHVENGFVSL